MEFSPIDVSPLIGLCGTPMGIVSPLRGSCSVPTLYTRVFTRACAIVTPSGFPSTVMGVHIPTWCVCPKPHRGGYNTGRGVNPCWVDGWMMGTPKGWHLMHVIILIMSVPPVNHCGTSFIQQEIRVESDIICLQECGIFINERLFFMMFLLSIDVVDRSRKYWWTNTESSIARLPFKFLIMIIQCFYPSTWICFYVAYEIRQCHCFR